MKRHTVYLLLFLMSLAPDALAQPFVIEPYATNPPDFIHLSYEDARRAAKEAANYRRLHNVSTEYVTIIDNQICDKRLDADKRVLAIYLLGALHPDDTNSIEILIAYIDLRATKFYPLIKMGGEMGYHWGPFPAQEALVKIGKPAFNPVLKHLSGETNELRRYLLRGVLTLVEDPYAWTGPPDFSKLSFEDAGAAVKEVLEWPRPSSAGKASPEYIGNLDHQIRDKRLDPANRVVAIYFLGELRPGDTASIDNLIDYIDLKATKFDPVPKTMYDVQQRWGAYPAQEALVKIGHAVIDPILKCLPGETKELRRYLQCEVLKPVEGKEAAQSQIKQMLANESDSTKERNLAAALKELEK